MLLVHAGRTVAGCSCSAWPGSSRPRSSRCSSSTSRRSAIGGCTRCCAGPLALVGLGLALATLIAWATDIQPAQPVVAVRAGLGGVTVLLCIGPFLESTPRARLYALELDTGRCGVGHQPGRRGARARRRRPRRHRRRMRGRSSDWTRQPAGNGGVRDRRRRHEPLVAGAVAAGAYVPEANTTPATVRQRRRLATSSRRRAPRSSRQRWWVVLVARVPGEQCSLSSSPATAASPMCRLPARRVRQPAPSSGSTSTTERSGGRERFRPRSWRTAGRPPSGPTVMSSSSPVVS